MLVPLAPQSFPIPLLVASFVLAGAGAVLYNISAISLMQTLTPERLLGRLNASRRFIVWGTIPLGIARRRCPRLGDRPARDVVGGGDRRIASASCPLRCRRSVTSTTCRPSPSRIRPCRSGLPGLRAPPPMPELPEIEAWVRELDPLVSAAADRAGRARRTSPR